MDAYATRMVASSTHFRSYFTGHASRDILSVTAIHAFSIIVDVTGANHRNITH
jgi:hypothetical protein